MSLNILSKDIIDICNQYKKEQKGDRDIRYFIKDLLKTDYKVVWSEHNDDTFMLIPNGKRFGRFIFSKKTYELLCGDIPPLTEVKWNNNSLLYRGEQKVYRIYSGYYVRIYWNTNRWEISLENSVSLDDLQGKNSLSTTGKIKITEEIEDLLRDKVNYEYMEKTKTYIYVLYSPRLISGIYYGDYEIVNCVAVVDNKELKIEYYDESETPEKEDAVMIGLEVMYSERYKISTSMIDRYKNLNYIILRNFKNSDEFFRYFPIESWKVQRGKLYEKIVGHSKYIARKINDFQLIKVRLKEENKKPTPENVMSIFDELPFSDLAVYLSINIF